MRMDNQLALGERRERIGSDDSWQIEPCAGLAGGEAIMPCVHLKQLYDLCEKNEVRLSATDLVHIVCHQCNQQEICPSTLMDEYDARGDDETKPAATDEQAS